MELNHLIHQILNQNLQKILLMYVLLDGKKKIIDFHVLI